MCYYYYYTIWFFWTERLGEYGGPDFTLLFISLALSASTYLPISLLLLYRRKRVPIVSARVPGRPAAVYYITLHYYDCCYHTMFGTHVWESEYNVQSTYFVSQFYAI